MMGVFGMGGESSEVDYDMRNPTFFSAKCDWHEGLSDWCSFFEKTSCVICVDCFLRIQKDL
jgi:hypothetical protein